MDSGIQTVTEVCPYCWEKAIVQIDVTAGRNQEYTEDCPVCCKPWNVRVEIDAEGNAHVELVSSE